MKYFWHVFAVVVLLVCCFSLWEWFQQPHYERAFPTNMLVRIDADGHVTILHSKNNTQFWCSGDFASDNKDCGILWPGWDTPATK